jgi:hypothetical protein
MKISISILVLLFLSLNVFSQVQLRKPLRIQIMSDTIRIQNGFVYNKNTNVKCFANANGQFEVLAQTTDILLFSAFMYIPKEQMLTDSDFEKSPLIVELKPFVNQLNEAVVYKKKVFDIDRKIKQAIMDKKYFNDQQSAPTNSTMFPDNPIPNGTNILRIIGSVVRYFAGEPKKKEIPVKDGDFIAFVKNKSGLESSFYTKTLHIDPSQIDLFLIFCDADPKSKTLLNATDEFKRLDFLISKSKEFKRL